MTKEEAFSAGKIACAHILPDEVRPARAAGRSLRSALLALRRQVTALGRRADASDELPSAMEWLLDHFDGYNSRALLALEPFRSPMAIPALSAEGDQARVLLLAQTAVSQGLDAEGCLSFFEGVQAAAPLSETEHALLGGALLLALLPPLRSRCDALLTANWKDASLDEMGDALGRMFDFMREVTSPGYARRLAKLSMAEQLLQQDPAGLYPKLDEESRMACRAALVRRAKRERRREDAFAQSLLQQAGEKGCSIAALLQEQAGKGAWYPLLIVGTSVLLAVLAGLLLRRWWSGVLLLLPLSELVKQCVDFVCLHCTPVRPLLRLDLADGIPVQGRTLCVIPALLTKGTSAERLSRKLEAHALVSRRAGKELRYGLLLDLADSPSGPDMESKAQVEEVRKAVAALNERYGGGFYLFYRTPKFAQRDHCWRGWERKRGALLELARFLRHMPSGIQVPEGDKRELDGTKFILTLDEDTRLLPDTAKKLVATLLCPLNRPQVDPVRKVVVSGYGILQPAVGVALESKGATAFARLFGGRGGTEPYAFASSELYRDLFDRASYTGKGLLEIDAFLVCLNHRFPENIVLSHDLLEGEYLRTGLAGDLFVLDSVPQHPLSYYRRMHRWTRGDWQTLPWLGRRVKNEFAQYVENPLSALSKWKILDNLRRSLVPVSLIAVLWAGACGTGGAPWRGAALVLIGLLVCFQNVLFHLLGCLLSKGKRPPNYRTKAEVGLSGALQIALARFVLLPCEAWIQLWGICAALYRRYITRKGLLDWTVSGAGGGGNRLPDVVQRLLPAAALGVAVCVLGQAIAGKLLGVLWLLSPWCAWYLGRPEPEVPPLTEADRSYLREEASRLWLYFDTFLKPEGHYLPPDNVQAVPAAGVAYRTSPTNMGLSLLACLAAMDLELAEPDRALFLIEQQLTALEQLERSHGHFYNWYNIRTMEPLYPRYLSTVDSGNLCAALIALAQGLEALEQPELAQRANKLAEEMDFAFLYDPGQHLFYIGWDAENGAYTNSWYDLMCSEARTASYVAIARGEVEPRHWRHLSRALVRGGRYSGMVSWSGTSFEYLMPQLLLSAPRGSLLRETLAFCVAEQHRNLSRQQGLWGISESAIFALNRDGSYAYQANGTPALALKRDFGRRVIAPYASMLALTITPRLAVKNLRRLSALGMSGPYGFYDAYDLTIPGGAIVQNWMVHHQGMGLVAIDNVLRENIMVRRFMGEASMAAFSPLLGEVLPAGPVMDRKETHMEREKQKPLTEEAFTNSGSGFDPEHPAVHLYSDGNLHTLCFADGGGWCALGGKRVTGGEAPIQVTAQQDGMEYRVFPCGAADKRLAWTLEEEGASLSLDLGSFCIRQRMEQRSGLQGQRCTFHAQNRSDHPLTVLFTLQPVLLEADAFDAHPAFARLGIESAERLGGVLFRRRPKDTSAPLCLAVLWDGPVADWDTDRAYANAPNGRTGAVCDPQLTLKVVLPGKGEASLTVAFAAGKEAFALRSAEGILGGLQTEDRSYARQIAENCWLTLADRLEADRMLSQMLANKQRSAGPANGAQGLWPFGLSGDLPIALLEVTAVNLEEAARFAAEHELLTRCGFHFDLVFLVREEGVEERLGRVLRKRHLPDTFGGTGGVHLLTDRQEEWGTLYDAAALVLQEGLPPLSDQPGGTLEGGKPLPPDNGTFDWHWEEDRFVLHLQGALPPRRWSHILTNERFGWLTDECGTGFLWYENAHENQLTPWQGDPLATSGAEDLLLCWEGGQVSLFARQDGWDTTVQYSAGCASWYKRNGEQEISLTVEIPLTEDVRRCKVTASGFSQPVQFKWLLRPQLAERKQDAPFCRVAQNGDRIVITNGANADFPGQELCLYAEDTALRCREQANGQLLLSCALKDSLCLVTSISALQHEKPRLLAAHPELDWAQLASPLRLDSPDEALNHYVSFWSLYQVVACRLFARTGLYQCGGAYGFRDQLQDICALIPTAPELAREQILRAAAHQFREGDVQHWWHPDASGQPERGVRTRISDDLLWLPYTLSVWVEITGDTSLLDTQAPWLTSDLLQPQEHERYEQPQRTADSATLYEHGCAAIHCVISRGTGSHGLLLMGCGDWNDGLNRIGAAGKGESVWLTWFAADVLKRWSALAEGRRDTTRAMRCQRRSEELAQAANRAWDGKWYLRGYDDEGVPFGSASSELCQIDSIAQSFSVFAPNPQPERAMKAVLEAVNRLHDERHGTTALLDPGFEPGSGAGYIQSYPAGVRENGGQYTHAAVWLARACYQLGLDERGWRILRSLLPENHPMEVYQGEPYVLAGDVSTAPGYEGRCGWSWYTGAAGWYYRTVTEELLGIRVQKGCLMLKPCLPEDWDGYRATLRLSGKVLHITAHRSGPHRVLVDGVPAKAAIPLETLGKTAEITVFCGGNEK